MGVTKFGMGDILFLFFIPTFAQYLLTIHYPTMLRKTSLFIVLAGMTLFGCTDFDCCTNSVIHATKKPVVLTNVGDSQTFVVSSSMAWKMTGTVPAWLSLDWTGYNPANPTGTAGVTNITATIQEPNTTGTERSASFTFLAANGDKAKVTVTQNATTEFTVTYDPNPAGAGVVSNMPANQTKTNGVALTLSNNIPTLAGCYFEVWNTMADGSGTTYDLGDSYTIDANVTLYAQWTGSVPIRSVAELAALATAVNSGNPMIGVTYKLMRDLDLTGSDPLGDGKGWAPIGTSADPFSGNFDGNHHTVSNLFIDRSATYEVGLFGCIDGASVQNLGVINADITGNAYVGGVAGNVVSGSVSNCYATGVVSGSYNFVGGVAGFVFYSSISNCYSTGAVSGSNTVGGVAGYVDGSSINNCYATGAVSGNANVGGVAGYVIGSSVANCVALNPSITRIAGSTGTTFGRVVGENYGTLTYNYANSSMAYYDGATLLPSFPIAGGGLTHENGADCDAVPTATWWTTTSALGWDWTAIWQVTAGSYPTLR